MREHKGDLLLLAIVSVAYVAVIFRYSTSPFLILLATVIFALCYLGWGIFHHLRQRNFHARVVLEYALIATLGVAIVATLLV